MFEFINISYSYNNNIVLDNFSTGRPQNLEHVINSINLIKCDISKPGDWQDLIINADYLFHLAGLTKYIGSCMAEHIPFKIPKD